MLHLRIRPLAGGNVVKNDSDFTATRATYPAGVKVKPAPQLYGFVDIADGFAGLNHSTIHLEPVVFMRRVDFTHAFSLRVMQVELFLNAGFTSRKRKSMGFSFSSKITSMTLTPSSTELNRVW